MEIAQNQSFAFQDIQAILQRMTQAQEKSSAEFDRKMEESRIKLEESRVEFDRKMEKSREDYELRMKKMEGIMQESHEDYNSRMKKMEGTMGSWANNHGFFAEEYFSNSFEKGKRNFFGEKFDEIEKNVKGIKKDYKDEYDILLINGKSIGIVEVKFKAHENDIPKILRKAETFRVNFPEYKNHQIYLGLATMVFYPELEQECINQGIAVIKQVGDTVVINDAHLRIF